MKSIKTMLKDITLEDLRDWAGSKIYNRGKEYTACVSQLSRTEEGTLVAWVSGSDEYAIWVRHEGQGNFNYDCTCPYDDGPCKHAVAVLLAASGQLKQRKEIPLLDPDGDLSLETFEADEDDDAAGFTRGPAATKATRGPAAHIAKLLTDKSPEQLLALILDLAGEFPEVARKVREQDQLDSGQTAQLMRSLHKEIRKLTSQEAWYSHWERRGNLPDYSHLEKQLQNLLNNGNADEVLELGEELWTRGIEQVECSNDEGMTATAISACLEIVLLALPQTELSATEQLLWLAERELEDQFSMLGDINRILNDYRYTPLHWREVAAVIKTWLSQLAIPKNSSFSERYHRERVVLWLRSAYLHSREPDKAISLLEQEAARCQCYEPLVKALIAAGELDRARQWCIKGFNQTIKEAPGIASGLQRQLRELAATDGRFDLVATYRAEDFFERPSNAAYIDLREAAEKVALWSEVRSGALNYLQTGKRPVADDKRTPVWPLPQPEVKRTKSADAFRTKDFPDRDMLIEIAILEKRLDDAVAIYKERTEIRHWDYNVDELLAKAVVTSHPAVALEIWQSIAESLIERVKPKAYQEAAKYLRQMHKVYRQTSRLTDWTALILGLRTRHKAKRRLMEVLDGLEKNRKLVD